MYCEMSRFGSRASAAGTRHPSASAVASRLRKELKSINHHLGFVLQSARYTAENIQVQANRFDAVRRNAGGEDPLGHHLLCGLGRARGPERHPAGLPVNGVD